MTKLRYSTIAIGASCLIVGACLTLGSATQTANTKNGARQRIPANEMRRVTAAATATAAASPLLSPEANQVGVSGEQGAIKKLSTTKRIGSDRISLEQSGKFQARMMRTDSQQQQKQQQHHQQQQQQSQSQLQLAVQQPQSQLLQARQHHSPGLYFMAPPDSWQSQGGLMSPFGDQESNDELATALASEIDATEAQLKQNAKAHNFTAPPSVSLVQKYPEPQQQQRESAPAEHSIVSALSLESRASREKQLAGAGNSGGRKQLASLVSSKDEYYGSEDEEDEEPELSAPHSPNKSLRGELNLEQQQQQQQQVGQPAAAATAQDKGQDKFRAIQENAESQYGDYAAAFEEGYRRQTETANRTANKLTAGSLSSLADSGGWAPSNQMGSVQDLVSQSQAANLQQQQQQQQLGSEQQHAGEQKQTAPTSKGTGERISDFFGGSMSKADVAIEYIRNILKSKQSVSSLASGNSTSQESASSPLAGNKSQSSSSSSGAPAPSKNSLLRLSSFASRLNQLLNSTSSSSSSSSSSSGGGSQQANSGTKTLAGSPSELVGQLKQAEQQQAFSAKSFLSQQAEASLGDVKQATLGPKQTYPSTSPSPSPSPSPSSSSLSSTTTTTTTTTTKLPVDPLVMASLADQLFLPKVEQQRQQMQQQQFAAADELAQAIASGFPLGGDYLDSLDDFPRSLKDLNQRQQRELVGMSESQSADSIRQPQEQGKFSQPSQLSQKQAVRAQQSEAHSSMRDPKQQHQHQQQQHQHQHQHHHHHHQQQQQQQQLTMISSKLYKHEQQISPQPATHHQQQSQQSSALPVPQSLPQQQQPATIKAIDPPMLVPQQQTLTAQQQQQQALQQQQQRSPKSKHPNIVSYNYFEGAPSENGDSAAELAATNYQLGDALYGSNGGLEHSLSQTELEAIQSQFLTAEHPVVPVVGEQQQQQQDAAALATILAGLKPDTIPSDVLQRLASPGKQTEEALKELASNEDLVMVPPPQPPQVGSAAGVASQQQSQQQRGVPIVPVAQMAPTTQYEQQQQQPLLKSQALLEQERQGDETRKLLAAAKSTVFINAAPDFEDDVKKKSLIVYLNHPRPIDMSKVGSSAQESYNLAQTVASEQAIESFISAKEFDSAHGLSKDSKQLDISNFGEIKDGQDKDGLSVVVIGDAYKYKKIVLLISSKSGGLKLIPMVKDIKKK